MLRYMGFIRALESFLGLQAGAGGQRIVHIGIIQMGWYAAAGATCCRRWQIVCS